MSTVMSRSTQIFLASICIVICNCEGFSNDQKSEQTSNFASQPAKVSFQSWSDWLDKRGLGTGTPWSLGDPSENQFQQWKEWMEKRGLSSAPPKGFGQFGKSNMQQWTDWYNKRGLKSPSFPAFGKSSRLQQWSDWMTKRGFEIPTGGLGNQDSNPGFQSWSDFSKRNKFDTPAAGFGTLGKAKMQQWNDWMKRQFQSSGKGNNFGPAFGAKNYLMKWDDYYKRSADKRQLGYVPSGFGSFSKYFTDGLQDWRSTFQGSKRSNTNKSDEE